MTNRLILITISSLILFGCNQSTDKTIDVDKKNEANTETLKTEITPFIISEVVLNDTNEIKTVGQGIITNGEWHQAETVLGYKGNYSQITSEQIQKILQSIIQSNDAKVYLDIDSNYLDRNEIFAFANCCDSIAEFDDKGNETKRQFFCDSTSNYNGITKIIFYESWYINSNNGSIEKDVLGYTLCHNLYNNEIWKGKGQYKAILHIFNSETSLQKTKKYLYIKTKELADKKK